MSDQDGTAEAAPTGLGKAERRLAIALVVVFVLMLVGLGFLRADKNWDRLVYLLSGFEAIVFAATGTLFGVSVQRGAVQAARKETDAARKDTAEAKAETAEAEQKAETNLEAATNGRAMARLIDVKYTERARPEAPIRGARPEDRPSGASDGHLADLAELSALARRLFPED